MKQIISGIEDFKEIIEKNVFYADKTNLIAQLMHEKVVLFTRPRRFGKTLNMSMLKYFYSVKENSADLFKGLNISNNLEAMSHLNQYPVISISLKDIRCRDFHTNVGLLRECIADQIKIYRELITNPCIEDEDRVILKELLYEKGTYANLLTSLKRISRCLEKIYHKKTIVLIDEYDVPLQAAYLYGYYEEMSDLIRELFSNTFKSNEYLEKGIMTGCLRVSKESIFTGLNNLRVYSTSSKKNATYFGLTQSEVDDLLHYFDILHHREMIRNWYDGYSFGGEEIYNPWSVLLCAQDLIEGEYNVPQSYWINTSSNDIIKDYIEKSDSKMREEFEILITGGSIEKRIKEELTYREMNDINNIYSFLLITGYLKENGKIQDKSILQIPNNEVKSVYLHTFEEWFSNIQNDSGDVLIELLHKKKIQEANDLINDLLIKSISFFDNYESFYHGLLTGLFIGKQYKVESNRESEDGRFDLAILPYNYLKTGFVIECKISTSLSTLEKDSREAAIQIQTNRYIEGLLARGYKKVIGYGISFYKKSCFISKL